MNELDFGAGIALVIFLLFCVCIIVASYLLDRTKWYYCPRCHHYHNQIGEKTALPWHGKVSGHVFPCKDCVQVK